MITAIEIRFTLFLDDGMEAELSERIPAEFLSYKPEELERVCAELIAEVQGRLLKNK